MIVTDLTAVPAGKLDETNQEHIRYLSNLLSSVLRTEAGAPATDVIYEAIGPAHRLVIHQPFISFNLDHATFWQQIVCPPRGRQERFVCLDHSGNAQPQVSPLDYRPLVGINLYSLVENPFTAEAHLRMEQLDHYAVLAEQLARRMVELARRNVETYLQQPDLEDYEKGALSRVYAALNGPESFAVCPIGLADMLAALGLSYASEKARATVSEVLVAICAAWGWSAEKAARVLMLSAAPRISRLAGVSDGVLPLLCPGRYDRQTGNYAAHAPLRQWLAATGQPEPDENQAEAWYEVLQRSPYAYEHASAKDALQRFPMQRLMQDFSAAPVALPFEFESASEAVAALPHLCEEARRQGCKTVAWTLTPADSACSLYEGEASEGPRPVWERRPQVLECDVVRFQNNKEKWVAFVGLLDGRPYEIFTGLQDDDEGIVLPKSVMKGHIIKAANPDGTHRYDFQFVNKRGYKTTVEGLSGKFNKEFWNYAKLISGVLRYRMPIETVIKLVGSMSMEDETINTWKTGVERALKKYVNGDGEA